ncbi:MAG TPA: response regulator [Bryobacteraceae bacterium]|jgi:DNA-binding response OmpR family regulator|nr:response regulator [Bryobacteraceae bacterium]
MPTTAAHGASPDTLTAATAQNDKRMDCVLLIEDSEDAMTLVRYALQEYGQGKYRLVWANNLSDGLGHLSRGGVDVVLLDLGLPESSGPTSYAWVRAKAPKVPVVVLTGDECQETEFSVLASGVEDYLIKDQISGSLLLQAIQAALHANKRRDEHLNFTALKFTQRFRWESKRRLT